MLGACENAACAAVDHCDDCSISGTRSCDTCIEGYAFDREFNTCEDTVCKKDLCEDCSVSGIYSCDQCREGFYYDREEEECTLLSCTIALCDKCDVDPKVCEQCVRHYWLDKETNECIDGTCLMENCADCSISGPNKCDKQNIGFFMDKDGLIDTCNPDSKHVICDYCTDGDTCIVCAVGYRLEDGKCKECDQSTCADCNEVSGHCITCKPGFFLDTERGTCEPCQEHCLECTSTEFCTTCDVNIHHIAHPDDGICQCDEARGWFKDDEDERSENSPWACSCYNSFFTSEGECTSCSEFFPGCTSCITAEESFLLGV